MPSLICSALIALAPMLMLFLTPGGVCLFLASPFWTVGMDVVFYFVDNQYPGKVVAVVSAVVAILFVFIVLSISVVLLWQEGRQGDEAVFTGHRVKDASVGKYGGEFTETCNNVNVAPFIALAFASVSGASPNHGHDEYSFLVGNPSLVKPENCEPSAGLSLDESCMPEAKGEACHKHVQVPVGTELASLSSVVPRPAGVPDGTFVTSVAKVASMTGTVGASSIGSSCVAGVDPLGETPSIPSAAVSGTFVPCSTGVPDGTFVASASNVASMTGTVEASASGSCGAVVEPSGKTSGFASSAVHCSADDGVAAALCCGNAGSIAITRDGDAEIGTFGGALDFGAGFAGTAVSGTASGDAKVDGACILGAVDSSVAFVETSCAFLESSVVAPSCTAAAISGVKRLRDDDSALLSACQVQAKKRKVVSPLQDGVLALDARLEARGIAATTAVNAWLVHGGTFGATNTTALDDPMDVCIPTPPLSTCAMPMDIEPSTALDSGDMEDVIVSAPATTDNDRLGSSSFAAALEPSTVSTSGGCVFPISPVSAATATTTAAVSSNAAFTTTTTPSASTTFIATAPATTNSGIQAETATTTTISRSIAQHRPRDSSASLALRRYAIMNAAAQRSQQQLQEQETAAFNSTNTPATVAATTTISTATTNAPIIAAPTNTGEETTQAADDSTFALQNSNTSNEHQNSDTITTTTTLESEEESESEESEYEEESESEESEYEKSEYEEESESEESEYEQESEDDQDFGYYLEENYGHDEEDYYDPTESVDF